MKKIILVTGVAGFIGARVAAKFQNEKFKVFGVDDLSTGNKKNIPKGIEFIKADISKKNIIDILPNRCDQILHLAGQSSGEISYENPTEDLKKNTISTLNLIEYGIKKKVKLFLYASSMSVYGEIKKRKVSENDICDPLSCYGVSKLTSEKYLKLFSDKLPFLSLRMFNVYGPGQDMNNLKQGMVSIFLSQAINNGTITVKGSLKRQRDFIFIDDVVNLWFELSKQKKILNRCINISTGKSVSVNYLTKLIIKKIKGTKLKVITGTKGDQFYVSSNNNLLKKTLNKKLFINLNDGLDIFLNSLKK